MGPDPRVQHGHHRASAVPGRQLALGRVEQDRDRGARVAAAEQVGIGAGRPGAAARVGGEAAAAPVGRAAGDGRADEQMLQRDLVDVGPLEPADVRLADVRLARVRLARVRPAWPAGEATAARSAWSATHASTVTGLPPCSIAVRTAVRGILASGWTVSWLSCRRVVTGRARLELHPHLGEDLVERRHLGRVLQVHRDEQGPGPVHGRPGRREAGHAHRRVRVEYPGPVPLAGPRPGG